MVQVIGALLVIVSALGGMVIGGATSTVAPRWHDPAAAEFYSVGAVLSALHLVFLAGVATLASGGALRGRLAWAGYAVTLAGLALQVVAETELRLSFNAGSALFGVVEPLMAVGFIVLGIAILRSRSWRARAGLVPLLCGLYVPVVLIPSFAIAKGPSFPALTGWQVLFLLLGIVMWREARQISRRAKLQSASPSTASTQKAHQAS
jgi:hypothetical protein